MEGTMKRLALHDRKACVEQAPSPSAHGANVGVRLESTPICGSDKKHFLNPDKTIRYAGHEGTGVVVEVDKSNLVKVGDRVLFGKYAGQTVKVNGEELLVMREEDIMGVLE